MVSGRCCRRKGEIRARRSLKTLFVAHMSQRAAEKEGFPHQDGALLEKLSGGRASGYLIMYVLPAAAMYHFGANEAIAHPRWFHSCQQACFAFRPPRCKVACGSSGKRSCCSYWAAEIGEAVVNGYTPAPETPADSVALSLRCRGPVNVRPGAQLPLATLLGQLAAGPTNQVAVVLKFRTLPQAAVRAKQKGEVAGMAAPPADAPPQALLSPGPYCFSFVAELRSASPTTGFVLLGPVGTLCWLGTPGTSVELGWWLGNGPDDVSLAASAFSSEANEACIEQQRTQAHGALTEARTPNMWRRGAVTRRTHNGSALLLLMRYGGYVQHFMQDLLWRLLNALDVLLARPDMRVVLEHSPQVERILRDVLGISAARIAWWSGASACASVRSPGPCELHTFQRVAISSVGPSRWRISINPTWGLGPQLLHRWVLSGRCGGGDSKAIVLLQRKHGAQRWLSNQEDVLAAMRRVSSPLGRVRVLLPQDYTKLSLVRSIFHETAVFVAPHGGQVVNILFGCPGAHVIEITPSYSYESMLVAFGFHYWPLRVRGEHNRPITTLQPERVAITLQRALGEAGGRAEASGRGGVLGTTI